LIHLSAFNFKLLQISGLNTELPDFAVLLLLERVSSGLWSPFAKQFQFHHSKMENVRPSMPWEKERAEPMGNVTVFATAHDLVITVINYQLLQFYSVLLKRIATDTNVCF
jgi:hypothetical protein